MSNLLKETTFTKRDQFVNKLLKETNFWKLVSLKERINGFEMKILLFMIIKSDNKIFISSLL